MAENGKKSVGKSILDGIRNISEEDWNDAMEKAEASEKDRTRWMAEHMQEDIGKKKVDGAGQPTSEPKEP